MARAFAVSECPRRARQRQRPLAVADTWNEQPAPRCPAFDDVWRRRPRERAPFAGTVGVALAAARSSVKATLAFDAELERAGDGCGSTFAILASARRGAFAEAAAIRANPKLDIDPWRVGKANLLEQLAKPLVDAYVAAFEGARRARTGRLACRAASVPAWSRRAPTRARIAQSALDVGEPERALPIYERLANERAEQIYFSVRRTIAGKTYSCTGIVPEEKDVEANLAVCASLRPKR